MPCSCQKPVENYPEASDWGPVLWAILHGLGERSGHCPFPLYYQDERIAWPRLFIALGKMIPCPSCKDHYDSYLREHPIPDLKSFTNEELYTYIRTWFWELHNWVNESLNKPIFPIESLEATYKTVPFKQLLFQLDKPMKLAIRLRGAQLLGYQDFLKKVHTLLSIYGV
jgi:hypothetical protein